jgi:hypothetical protein
MRRARILRGRVSHGTRWACLAADQACTGPDDPPRHGPLRSLDRRLRLNRVNVDRRRQDARAG